MSNVSKKMLMAAAGAAGGDALNVEDVFSTYLYEGNASNSHAIVNNIDLAGEGGMIWIKNRDDDGNHYLLDTERGDDSRISSNRSDAETTGIGTNFDQFTSTGFILNSSFILNANNDSFVSWTFRKAPKFFDVVTYTSTGTAGLAIDHSLGSVPGSIFVKCTSHADNWYIYHRGISGDPEDQALFLDTNAAAADNTSYFNDTAPTATQFTLGDNAGTNAGFGRTYVAYIFAHETESDSMIQCGSYDGNESTYPTITLGWEPQWILVKSITNTRNWAIFDTMRGLPVGGGDEYLRPNTTGAETTNDNQHFNINATGFSPSSVETLVNGNGETYIYVAIRRPNMKTHTDATKVFAVAPRTNTIPSFASGFPVDFCIGPRTINGSDNNEIKTRLISDGYLRGNTTGAETASGQVANFGHNDGFFNFDGADANQYSWMWKRAKGYFDVVAYTGNDTARTIAHGLGVVPEMIWVKTRSTANAWWVYYGDNTDYLVLNTTAATVDSNYPWQDTSPTSSVFTVGDIANVNENGATIIAYLFATLAGVSKIGTVTHSGSSTDVACGFSAGARFVMLKRVDATGDWYFWDSVRGIVSGNDPYLLFNTNAAQVTNTDLIDPLSSGFQISGDFTDGDYIFYAIA